MTKEELIYEVLSCVNTSSDVTCEILLNEFFVQNVVIPKGSQLQEFADGRWWDLCYISENCEYRIKPSEPVYEWQWVVQEKKGGEYFVPQGWHTFEELQPQVWSLVRLEETKRIRQ